MIERLGDQIQGNGTILDAGTSPFVQANERTAGGNSELHELAHFLAINLTQGATKHGAVLREHAHFPTINRAPTGDNAIRSRSLAAHTEIISTVTG